jgi:uncharacterized RmlC-like cupin family protein
MEARDAHGRDDGVQVFSQADLALQEDGSARMLTAAHLFGMRRLAAETHLPPGISQQWFGTVDIPPGASTTPHHHGGQDSLLCVVSGRLLVRWGDDLLTLAAAGPGECVFIPPWIPHQEANASPSEGLSFILIRNDEPAIEVSCGTAPEPSVRWRDPHHLRSP